MPPAPAAGARRRNFVLKGKCLARINGATFIDSNRTTTEIWLERWAKQRLTVSGFCATQSRASIQTPALVGPSSHTCRAKGSLRVQEIYVVMHTHLSTISGKDVPNFAGYGPRRAERERNSCRGRQCASAPLPRLLPAPSV
ncbi:hypothetical protein EVAR_889_1 [Eumeta japonica]|uniref:Uncharacterized protein n=1 Tax=Eumeta variegata TaxID=151549 RepID=A0A4C1SDQ1_EUMVA|nr:hypothetical protein EVAR_889_1 [Eumeta japonica]